MNEMVLDGIREKLKRADEHLAALHTEIGDYFKGEPHDYRLDADYAAGTYSIRVAIKRPPPIRLGVICGDYVHCLRSVLDHLVCANVPNVTRSTAFPVITSPGKFRSEVVVPAQKNKRGPLTGIDPKGRLFAYIESAQPYRAKDGHTSHALWNLAELSNADKHRAILARASGHRKMDKPSLSFEERDIRYLGKGQFVYDKPLDDGDEVVRGRFKVTGPKPKVTVRGNLPVQVAFGEHLVVAESLGALGKAVHEIASKIAVLDGQRL